MSSKEKAILKTVKVKLKLPFIDIEGAWEASIEEQKAAWELYVELITRIGIEELRSGEGLLREAMNSLYDIFPEVRKILKNYGPTIALPKGKGKFSFGFLAVAILNSAIRPILAKWHPILLDYENTKPDNISAFEHEKKWSRNKELRRELNKLRNNLKIYANILAEVANVPLIEVKR